MTRRNSRNILKRVGFFLPIQMFAVLTVESVLAQSAIVPDDTLGEESSQVRTDEVNGLPTEVIEGGAQRGSNLFHSFSEFNVNDGRGAYFANPTGIENILGRVTGANPSQILGTLGVLGNADLFLINPNGIIFGQNARLDVNGSFLGSTADSLLFPDGEFSARDTQTEPLLTVNVPIGLGLGDNPGAIVNRSFVQNSVGDFVGLEVPPGENLTLVGGDINFEGGEATASGGRIELGGLRQAGEVTFNSDGSLSFPKDIARADVTLSNATDVDVTGTGGGDIVINARNLRLEAGELGFSAIRAGITANSTDSEAQAGNIIVNATNNVIVDDSVVSNQINPEAEGNAGDVTITTGSLSLSDGGIVSANTFGLGNAGSVFITARDTITIDGEGSNSIPSSVTSQIAPGTEGDGGNVTITTGSLSLSDGGIVSANTFGLGNAGSVFITARDTITIDGEGSNSIPSSVTSQIAPGTEGDGGNVTITTGSLSLTNGGVVGASTFGRGNAGSVEITVSDTIAIDGETSDGSSSNVSSQVNLEAEGNAGDVTITTGSLSLTNGGGVSTNTFGLGNAGSVFITARDTIAIDGENLDGIFSTVASQVAPEAEGNAGDVIITTGSLSLSDGGAVGANTFGLGNAGSVFITARDTIAIDGEKSDGNSSAVASQVASGVEGEGGNITITTDSLSLTNGGLITASAPGRGNAGSVSIIASDTIAIDGEKSDGFPSAISTQVTSEAEGNGGDITITTDALSLSDGGFVSATTFGRGDAGSVFITARDTIAIDGGSSDDNSSIISTQVILGAEGEGGDITITTGSLSLTNGGAVIADTEGLGNAGSVFITARDTIAIDSGSSDDNPSIVSTLVAPEAEGKGGDITITTGSLSLTNGGTVNAGTSGRGNAGSVSITASDTIAIDGEGSNSIPSAVATQVILGAEGDGGDITITTDSLSLIDGGFISANTSGRGNAGLVSITASDTIAIDGEDSDGFPSGVSSQVNPGAEGNAEDITITIDSLSLTNGGFVTAGTLGQGNAGSIEITAGDTITINGEALDGIPSNVSTQVSPEAEGEGGDITITTDSLSLTNGGAVGANTLGQGNAGDVNVTAFRLTLQNRGRLSVGGQRDFNPGNLDITADNISLDNQSFIEANTESGNQGNITLNTQLLTLRNNSNITTNARGSATGGNITINAEDGFIIAVPDENSDITANATTANGGQVTINAQSLFGIEAREQQTPLSDITASSDLGVQFGGDVTINTPEVDPESGLNELPTVPIDADAIIAQNFCRLENDRIAGGSSFTIIGKGGLPPTADDPIINQTRIVDWAKPTEESFTPSRNQPEINSNSNNTVAENTQPVIQQARGWAKTKDGKIVLTADAPIIAPQTGEIAFPNCNVN